MVAQWLVIILYDAPCQGIQVRENMSQGILKYVFKEYQGNARENQLLD